jgi:hypothetical protein
MSRDPNEGSITIPAALHKYLYADGDPVNGIDPTGRADFIESIFSDRTFVSSPSELIVENAARSAIQILCGVANLLNALTNGIPPGFLPWWWAVRFAPDLCTASGF